MTKAVRVHKVGGPEALVYEDVEVAAPGPGEVRIRSDRRDDVHARQMVDVVAQGRPGMQQNRD